MEKYNIDLVRKVFICYFRLNSRCIESNTLKFAIKNMFNKHFRVFTQLQLKFMEQENTFLLKKMGNTVKLGYSNQSLAYNDQALIRF